MVQLAPELVVYLGNTPDGAGSPWLLPDPPSEPVYSEVDAEAATDEQTPTPLQEA